MCRPGQQEQIISRLWKGEILFGSGPISCSHTHQPDLWPKSCQSFSVSPQVASLLKHFWLFDSGVCVLQALTEYKAELRDDPIINTHLAKLYENLLEQNLIRVIEPFSRVQVRTGSAWHRGVQRLSLLLFWAGPKALRLWCFWCRLTWSRLIFCFQIEHISGLIKLSKVRSCWWTVLSLFSSIKCGVLFMVSF